MYSTTIFQPKDPDPSERARSQVQSRLWKLETHFVSSVTSDLIPHFRRCCPMNSLVGSPIHRWLELGRLRDGGFRKGSPRGRESTVISISAASPTSIKHRQLAHCNLYPSQLNWHVLFISIISILSFSSLCLESILQTYPYPQPQWTVPADSLASRSCLFI